MPEGKVEPNETKEQALIRECREELDILICPESIFMELNHVYPDIEIHLTLYNAHIESGILKNLEHKEIRWIFPEEIPQYKFCPADKQILEKLLSKIYN